MALSIVSKICQKPICLADICQLYKYQVLVLIKRPIHAKDYKTLINSGSGKLW